MQEIINHFDSMTREQILAFPAGSYADYDLLSVGQYFEKNKDNDRAMAIYELILRSPEVTEMMTYGELYFELVNYYRWKGDYSTALQWCYAMIAFSEQHEEGMNRQNHRRDLADIYLVAGELNVGLMMYTQMLHGDPGEIWLYNSLGLELPRVGLSELAVDALEKGLELVASKDPHQLKDQLASLRDESIDQAQSDPSRLDEVSANVLANLQAALKLPAEINEGYDSLTPYSPAVTRLTELGEEQDEAVYSEIIALGRPLTPSLIQLAYDPEIEWGDVHAVALLRTLRDAYPDELALLTPWLDQAEGDWQVELLSGKMGKVGGYTTQALQQIVVDTEENKDIRASALEAMRERAQRLPEQRDSVVSFFRTLFTRPEAYEASEEFFMARLVSEVVDLDARQLYPEVRQVFDEDRLEPGWLDLDFVHRKWDMPRIPPPKHRRDGLYLPVVCTNCGRTREHFTEYVLVNINSVDPEDESQHTDYNAHILDHEIVCPKCGSVDRYEMTPMASLRMAGPEAMKDIFRTQTGKKPKKIKANPRVLYIRSAVFGKPMHPLDGLDEYRRRIAARPKDAKLHARMGSLLRTLMRYSEALQALRHANKLAPNDTAIMMRRAFSEHDFGDIEVARQLYQRIIDQAIDPKKGPLQRVGGEAVAAVDGLRNLKRNRPSPIKFSVLTLDGKPVEHPSLSWRGRTQTVKTSRTKSLKTVKGKTKRGRRKK